MSIFERVRAVLARVLRVPESWVTERADLYYDLLADSLDVSRAILAVEDEFSIDLGDQFDATATVAGIVVAVAARVQVEENRAVFTDLPVAVV